MSAKNNEDGAYAGVKQILAQPRNFRIEATDNPASRMFSVKLGTANCGSLLKIEIFESGKAGLFGVFPFNATRFYLDDDVYPMQDLCDGLRFILALAEVEPSVLDYEFLYTNTTPPGLTSTF